MSDVALLGCRTRRQRDARLSAGQCPYLCGESCLGFCALPAHHDGNCFCGELRCAAETLARGHRMNEASDGG